MKVSEKWLREWVPAELSGDELNEALTMLGLEVDDYSPLASFADSIVVAKIVSFEPHPDASKLNVCQVDNGNGLHQVVCGAPNVSAGLVVPMATVGTTMPNGMQIKSAKLRGVESNGMLCSASELGLSEDHSGLMPLDPSLPLGQPLIEALGMDDHVIDVAITPNRGDCVSIRGLAIDLSARLQSTLNLPELSPVAAGHSDQFPIQIEPNAPCGRYVGRVVKGIDAKATAPEWMTKRLLASGIRSISLAVDITNYVMLELGQPMHAFDLDTLANGIVVRLASGDEQITLLDGREITPDANTLLIADHEKPLAIAGIMGSENSGVSDATVNVLFESAWFHPDAIQGRLRQYNCHTESGYRFERGVDPEAQAMAIERATALLIDIAGGEAGPLCIEENSAYLPSQRTISLSKTRLLRLLGFDVSDEAVNSMLTTLGCEVDQSGDVFTVTPPLRRFDLNIEEDLVEEVARVYGFDRIPRVVPKMSMPIKPLDESLMPIDTIKDRLVARGYNEAVTYSFIRESDNTVFNPDVDHIALSNPISSEMGVMRDSLLPGLCRAAAYNQARQRNRVRLFESGLRFAGEGAEEQHATLAGLIVGSQFSENWRDNGAADFFSVKADIEDLCAVVRGKLEFAAAELPGMHPGRTAQLLFNRKPIGWFGELHPETAEYFELHGRVIVWQMDLSPLLHRQKRAPSVPSKYPSVRRDIALLVPNRVSVSQLLQAVNKAKASHLVESIVFDNYTGKGVEPGYRNVAIGLVFQSSSSTLDDLEVDNAVEKTLQILNKSCEAQLRH
ncbi:MAG: phenylalanine--tRNA ligase subunit beta [Gammaproteobacteria bacterium]|nr:phenylalanine--tRNA ligase subunit beta [Gammaproteobacteria bacterium]